MSKFKLGDRVRVTVADQFRIPLGATGIISRDYGFGGLNTYDIKLDDEFYNAADMGDNWFPMTDDELELIARIIDPIVIKDEVIGQPCTSLPPYGLSYSDVKRDSEQPAAGLSGLERELLMERTRLQARIDRINALLRNEA